MTTNSYVNLPLVNAEELQNVLVSPTNPIDGYVLEYVAADDEWEAKKITASSTTSVTMGGDVINNSTTSTVVKIQGVSVSSTAPTDGYVLEYSASSTQWQPTKLPTIPTSFTVGGDLSGTTNSATVNKINGNAVKQQTLSSTNDGYILTWVNANSNWESKTASISFTVGGDLGGSNTNQIVKSITGASDVVNIASDTLIFANGLTAPILCQNATGSVAAPLTIAAQTSITGPGGNLILQSGQGGIGGQPNGQVLLKNAGNTVASLTSNKLYLDVGINYKTIATSISYKVLLTDRTIICSNTSAPITITLPSTMTEGDEYVVIDGIGSAATYNITVNGNGATINGSSTYVINANFASITIISDGANWHAQICQAATTPTTTVSMGGDISGSSNASTVNKIQGVSVSSTAPTDGYVLEYSASSTQWRPTKLPITYTLSGDVTGNSSSSTVIAIQGNKVKPATYGSSQDGYVLYWNNTDGYIETKAVSSGSSVTWANDLAGSTATNQYVAAISGNAGAGGVIPINGTTTNLQIASNNTTFGISQLIQTGNVATNDLKISPQKGSASSSGTNSASGNINILLQSDAQGAPNVSANPTSQVIFSNDYDSQLASFGFQNGAAVGSTAFTISGSYPGKTSAQGISWVTNYPCIQFIKNSTIDICGGNYGVNICVNGSGTTQCRQYNFSKSIASFGGANSGYGVDLRIYNSNNNLIFGVGGNGGLNNAKGTTITFGSSTTPNVGIIYQNYSTKTANYTLQNTTNNNDHIIFVNTVTAAVATTQMLPSSPGNGECYIIKDSTGAASSYNITVSGNGKNIDGSATYVININYGYIKVIFNGSQWSIMP